MQLDRWSKWDLIQKEHGFALVLKDPLPWSGKAIFFSPASDGSFAISCIIEEQGVPSVCWELHAPSFTTSCVCTTASQCKNTPKSEAKSKVQIERIDRRPTWYGAG